MSLNSEFWKLVRRFDRLCQLWISMLQPALNYKTQLLFMTRRSDCRRRRSAAAEQTAVGRYYKTRLLIMSVAAGRLLVRSPFASPGKTLLLNGKTRYPLS